MTPDRRRIGFRLFPVMTVLLAVGLLCAVCWSIITPLFLAAVVAGTLHPITTRVTKAFRGHKNLAAIAVTVGAMLVFAAPLAAFTTLAIGQAARVGVELEEANTNGRVAAAIERLPGALREPARDLMDHIPTAAEVLRSGGTSFFGMVKLTGGLMLDVALGLIALFFFLLEGPALIRWLEKILPVPGGQFRSLLGEFRRVSRSVLVAQGAIAGVQALSGLIGLLIAGVPNPVFFTLAIFFLALVPAVGAASCFVVLSAVYLLDGHTGTGIFLLVWGLLVVGLLDNLLKPMFIRGGAAMHGAVVFFALLGGLAAFGAPGLIAGPLIVAFFIAVMNVTAAAADASTNAPLEADVPVPRRGVALGRRSDA